MKRTQIQLDDATYEALRRRAFEQGSSMASIVRDIVAEELGTKTATKRKLRIEDFTWIGSGRGKKLEKAKLPISVHHDDALVEDYFS